MRATLSSGQSSRCRKCAQRSAPGANGRTDSPHYDRWYGIKARTTDPTHKQYPDYGGRGIEMYGPWVDDFMAFDSWFQEKLGPCPPGHSLDRIDNEGHYEPGNLRWATPTTQNRNKRTARSMQVEVNYLLGQLAALGWTDPR